ncbi:hypothetical protein DFH08DRAFT_703938 [Mycena albidolilacea]|uniref:DUF5648 domain-containing protein n=1 Tax=Mycena albidolilacea TaxID=1033008 RepID=A0AAD7EN35_9AGAR|nr:hypothetical protein DFH08DRAFT_703938 [Mycena albidolilacea]
MAQCSSCPKITPLYRSFNAEKSDHFYTSFFSFPDFPFNAGEMAGAASGGYNPEGVAAAIFPTQLAGSTPLFRLFKASVVDHPYTTSTIEINTLEAAGYALEPTPGYVYTTQICDSVPLYGLFIASHNDHFYTTSLSERSAVIAGGWADLGVTAYVPLPGIINNGSSC